MRWLDLPPCCVPPITPTGFSTHSSFADISVNRIVSFTTLILQRLPTSRCCYLVLAVPEANQRQCWELHHTREVSLNQWLEVSLSPESRGENNSPANQRVGAGACIVIITYLEVNITISYFISQRDRVRVLGVARQMGKPLNVDLAPVHPHSNSSSK